MFAAKRPGAEAQFAKEGTLTSERVEADKALKREALRAQSAAALSSLDAGALQGSQ